MSIRFSGAFSDILSWLDMQNLPSDIARVSRGEETVGGLIGESAMAPFNKLANSAVPIPKTVAETVSGYSSFPEPFGRWRPIRDRTMHAAGVLGPGVRAGVAALKDIPQSSPLTAALLNSQDPGEAAYHRARSEVFDWLASQGKERGAGTPTDKANAIYYSKRAMAMGQKERAERWRQRYFALGGTRDSMQQSIDASSPIAGLKISDRSAFLRQLSPRQKKDLQQAWKWWRRTYRQ
jgi:hypothetical protein